MESNAFIAIVAVRRSDRREGIVERKEDRLGE
jgi:hypothetical protein